MSEPTEAQRIAILEKRVDMLLAALRGQFSGMGKEFCDATFNQRWKAAEDEE